MMATTIKLDPARELGVAIRLMALRMVYTERDMNREIFLAPAGEPFTKTAKYLRMENRRRYQEKALARLVYALTDLVPR
jgi:hypothetical protein